MRGVPETRRLLAALLALVAIALGIFALSAYGNPRVELAGGVTAAAVAVLVFLL